jgi:hypothetical protein
MCKKIEKTVDHIFLHCDVASILLNSLFSRFGMSSVMPRQVIDLLTLWCLWWERNNKGFEDLERSLEEIISLLYHSLYC